MRVCPNVDLVFQLLAQDVDRIMKRQFCNRSCLRRGNNTKVRVFLNKVRKGVDMILMSMRNQRGVNIVIFNEIKKGK